MRCSAWSSLAISVCSALLLAPSAAAHVTPTPSFITADATTSLRLSGPNERGEPMTAFVVTVPVAFRVVAAEPSDGWTADATESTATWRGGRLEAGKEATFTLRITAPKKPGAIELEAVQRYPGGESVRWPVGLTVIPGFALETRRIASIHLSGVVIFTVLGLLPAGVVVVLVRRKRRRSLQER